MAGPRLTVLRLRSAFILIGETVSLFHSVKQDTEVLDVVARTETILYLHGATLPPRRYDDETPKEWMSNEPFQELESVWNGGR